MTTKPTIKPHRIIKEGEHLIGKFVGDERGATLLVIASVHGNEAGGTHALQKAAGQLENLRENLRGRVYLLAGNTRALSNGVRFIDFDLNRFWTAENLIKNRLDSPDFPESSEDCEQRELLKIINEILATACDEVYALDLHSTSAAGLPFATVGDTMRNRRFAQKFPVTILLGIEEQLDGTLLEYLNNFGVITFGFEGGQHFSSETIENHEALVWLALVNSGILSEKDAPDLEKHRQNLARATGAARILEVRHREAVKPEDEFEMNPGFENFDSVRRGQILAKNKQGIIEACESGLIMMPLYQKLGEDGFFIGRVIAPFWLRLSAVLRKLNVAGLMHLLPGVKRHPTEYGTLLVNTRIARFFPLQIFHLLGFRKRRLKDNKLIVSQRRYDEVSPFKNRGR